MTMDSNICQHSERLVATPGLVAHDARVGGSDKPLYLLNDKKCLPPPMSQAGSHVPQPEGTREQFTSEFLISHVNGTTEHITLRFDPC